MNHRVFSRLRRSSFLGWVSAGFCGLALAHSVAAQDTKLWEGSFPGFEGEWDEEFNWAPEGVPQAGDAVEILNTVQAMLQSHRTIGSLLVAGPDMTQSHLTISGSSGNLVVSDMARVGTGTDRHGLLEVAGGAEFAPNELELGVGSGSRGVVAVAGENSRMDLQSNSQLTIGSGGEGMLLIEEFGQVAAGSVTMGLQAGSTSTLEVRGGDGFSSGNYSGFAFGTLDAGAASIEVSEGGVIVSADSQVQLGRLSGETTSMHVTGGNSMVDVGDLTVGMGGSASLLVSNSALLVASNIDLANEAHPAENISMIVQNATLEVSNNLRVGSAGQAAFVLEEVSAATVNGGFVVGESAGAVGQVAVNNPGSILTAGSIVVGDGGSGELIVDGNGEVSSGNPIVLASQSGSSGTLVIGAPEGDPPGGIGIISAPSIHGGSGTAVVVFNHDNEDYDFGVVSMTGSLSVRHEGPGTTRLTAAQSYTGITEVSNGTFLIENGLSPSAQVVVEDGAAFGGSGQTGEIALNAGGRLLPAPGIGALESGPLNWAGGASMEFQLGQSASTSSGISTTILGKGAGSGWFFEFVDGADGVVLGDYTLIEFGALSDLGFGEFQSADFSAFYTGPAPVFDGFFTLTSDQLIYTVTAIPEPSATALGLAGLLLLVRRRTGSRVRRQFSKTRSTFMVQPLRSSGFAG